MSRVGAMPIAIVPGVEVVPEAGAVEVKGSKGALRVPFDTSFVDVEVIEGMIRVARRSDEKQARALHGLTRSLIANAVIGVSEGFSKHLDLFGVGYRAEVEGRRLTLNIGYSHPVYYDAPDGVEVSVGDVAGSAQARITVSGIDKQQVGQAAADIRQKRKPEPYKGKGIRYEDEIIHWKTGKAAVG